MIAFLMATITVMVTDGQMRNLHVNMQALVLVRTVFTVVRTPSLCIETPPETSCPMQVSCAIETNSVSTLEGAKHVRQNCEDSLNHMYFSPGEMFEVNVLPQ